uniref:Uncharacterized protein n=1 Tax=Leersia perrieri TaxID=77586 RepID=A0A0D9WTX5_9ORYZ
MKTSRTQPMTLVLHTSSKSSSAADRRTRRPEGAAETTTQATPPSRTSPSCKRPRVPGASVLLATS